MRTENGFPVRGMAGVKKGLSRDGRLDSPIRLKLGRAVEVSGQEANPRFGSSARGIARGAGLRTGYRYGRRYCSPYRAGPNHRIAAAFASAEHRLPCFREAGARPLSLPRGRERSPAGKTRIRICAIWYGHPGHSGNTGRRKPVFPQRRSSLRNAMLPKIPAIEPSCGDFARSYIRPEPAPGASPR